MIADVTVPYESGPEALKKARIEKMQKYEGLRVWMLEQEQYLAVTVQALAVGSLGACNLKASSLPSSVPRRPSNQVSIT